MVHIYNLYCRLRGLLVVRYLFAVALCSALVAIWALYSSRSTWLLGSTLAAASGFSLLQRRRDSCAQLMLGEYPLPAPGLTAWAQRRHNIAFVVGGALQTFFALS